MAAGAPARPARPTPTPPPTGRAWAENGHDVDCAPSLLHPVLNHDRRVARDADPAGQRGRGGRQDHQQDQREYSDPPVGYTKGGLRMKTVKGDLHTAPGGPRGFASQT